MIKIEDGDCFELIKKLDDNSVDLVITSPPYSDIVNYGKQVSIKTPDEYVDWILPLFREIYRVLKPSGSFILNINDKTEKGLRSTYIYDLISRNNKETKLKLYDTYIWHKKNGIPNGGKKRFRNTTEFIFHFVKDVKQLKFYIDRVLKNQSKATSERRKYKWTLKGHGVITDGIRGDKSEYNAERLPDKVRPDNVFRFSTAAASRDNLIKHPAPFHIDLPLYFINFLTDEGDLILDPFSGIGTTGLACKDLNRNYIGYELNKKYVDFSIKRIDNILFEQEVIIEKYDLSGNLIKTYNNINEAANDTPGSSYHNILRSIDRNDKKTNAGYIWKKITKNYDN